MKKKIKSFDNTIINYEINRYSDLFIIFLHGLGGDLTVWNYERKFFNNKKISTIAVDLRGHGLSSRPNKYQNYNLKNFAKDIYSIIKKEKISKFIIVGHCFGGAVTLTFQKLYPNTSESLVLISSTDKSPANLKRIFNLIYLKRAIYKLSNKVKLKNKKFKHRNFNKFIGTTDWDYKRIYSDIEYTSSESWIFTLENFSKFNGIKTLKKTDIPVLILNGERDSIFNVSVSKRIKKITKKSILKIIPNENHIITINNPNAISREIYKFIINLKLIKNNER